jgi:hypothetical protein
MAWYNSLKDLTGDVKKGATDVGHAVGTVAKNPIVDLGIGAFLGPGAAAAAKGLGTLMAPGGNLGSAALGTAEGYGLGKVGQLGKTALSSVLGTGSAAAAPGAAGAAGAASATGASPAASSGGFLDSLKSLLGKAGILGGDVLGAVNGATGGGSLVDKGLLAAAVADAAATKKRQQDLQDQGLSYATDAYSAKQPLRQQGLSLLQSQTAPDLSFLANSANPYTAAHALPTPVGPKVPVLPTTGTY